MTAPAAIAHLPAADPTSVPRSTVALLTRARSLRAQAGLVNPIVAQAYLRRATELRLQASAHGAGRPAPTETDDSPAAA